MMRAKVALVHIPRTGGTALGSLIFHQTRADPTYYFSFFGLDSSQGANRIIVERLQRGDERWTSLLDNRHFQECRVMIGHFSADIESILDPLELQFAAVLREPIARSVSLIYKYSSDVPGRRMFGSFRVPSKSRDREAYWTAILQILSTHPDGAIPGLLAHESMMLANGMCHMIGGSPLHTYRGPIPFDRVLANLPRFKLGLFERFNETCAPLMRELGIPVALDERTNHLGNGNPAAQTPPYYDAPEEVLDLVRALNEDDRRLYRLVTEERLYVGAESSR
jgi:hypothetical protein